MIRALVVGLLAIASIARADFVLSGAAMRSLEALFDIPSGQIVMLDMKCRALPALSSAGRARIVCDNSTNTLKASVNGGAFGAFGGGGGSPAGGTNAVQSNAGGGNFGDSGCTAVNGAMSCGTYTSTDQNNAGVNVMAVLGNASTTTPAVDCATNGATKRLTTINSNKTDTDSARIWSHCYGTAAGLVEDAGSVAGNKFVSAAPGGVAACGDSTHVGVWTIDSHGTATCSAVGISGTSFAPTNQQDIFEDFIGPIGSSPTADKPQGVFGLNVTCSSGAASAQGVSAPDNNTPGVAHWLGQATSGAYCTWFNLNTATKPWRNFPADTTWWFESRFTLQVQTNIAWAWGLADVTAATDPTAITNGLFVQFNPASDATHYLCTTCNGGTCGTTAGAAVSTAGTYDKIRLNMSVANTLQCCINGACVTNNAHAPAATTTLGHFASLKDVTATQMITDTDYWWMHTPATTR
jgi:hypothetical protein